MSKLETISDVIRQYNRIRIEAEVKIAQAELAIAKANADEMEDLERLSEQRKNHNRKHWRRCESDCCCCCQADYSPFDEDY